MILHNPTYLTERLGGGVYEQAQPASSRHHLIFYPRTRLSNLNFLSSAGTRNCATGSHRCCNFKHGLYPWQACGIRARDFLCSLAGKQHLVSFDGGYSAMSAFRAGVATVEACWRMWLTC